MGIQHLSGVGAFEYPALTQKDGNSSLISSNYCIQGEREKGERGRQRQREEEREEREVILLRFLYLHVSRYIHNCYFSQNGTFSLFYQCLAYGMYTINSCERRNQRNL